MRLKSTVAGDVVSEPLFLPPDLPTVVAPRIKLASKLVFRENVSLSCNSTFFLMLKPFIVAGDVTPLVVRN